MQLITIAALFATITTIHASSGAAYPSLCGYYLVNQGVKSQAEIAQIKCGRSDTCNGEEWNTVYSMSLAGKWYAQQFCSKGCYVYEGSGTQLASCH